MPKKKKAIKKTVTGLAGDMHKEGFSAILMPLVFYLLPMQKLVRMVKSILLFCSLFLFACAERSPAPANQPNTPAAANANWSTEREMLFLSGCIENAKSRYSDTAAYTLCNCMLAQVKQQYPDADSATLMRNLEDTTVVLKMMQHCQ